MRSVLLPALQNVLQPIMAVEKSKKSLARPGYIDPCAPPEPEPEEAVDALLGEAVKQTALLSEVIAELREMRRMFSNCVWAPQFLLFPKIVANLCIGGVPS
jgi:hypothetical protein